MNYLELSRAGSHGTSGVGVVIVLSACYVSLITCCSAKGNAVGAWVMFCGPRGVICITRGVIDKAGLNWLLVPHQSPFLPSQPIISPPPNHTMPSSRYTNTYTILFDPIHNGSGEVATAKESFNRQHFVKKRGSRSTPYPAFVDADPFNDLFLADFIESNKRQEIIFGALW
jgi:hypothetical protein